MQFPCLSMMTDIKLKPFVSISRMYRNSATPHLSIKLRPVHIHPTISVIPQPVTGYAFTRVVGDGAFGAKVWILNPL